MRELHAAEDAIVAERAVRGGSSPLLEGWPRAEAEFHQAHPDRPHHSPGERPYTFDRDQHRRSLRGGQEPDD
eukprot:13926982-Alexandrium_andersonii.AAC.1